MIESDCLKLSTKDVINVIYNDAWHQDIREGHMTPHLYLTLPQLAQARRGMFGGVTCMHPEGLRQIWKNFAGVGPKLDGYDTTNIALIKKLHTVGARYSKNLAPTLCKQWIKSMLGIS